jgi:hypothetical protein
MLSARIRFKAFASTCLVGLTLLSASPASAARVWYECHVKAVNDGSPELPYYSAHCVEPWVMGTTSVEPFIVLVADPERSARFFNVAMAALLSGRLLTVMFETNEVTPCGGVDCRTAIYFGLKR